MLVLVSLTQASSLTSLVVRRLPTGLDQAHYFVYQLNSKANITKTLLATYRCLALPSPIHSGVAVLSSISSCAPQSTFTFTFRVCITYISHTQILSLPITNKRSSCLILNLYQHSLPWNFQVCLHQDASDIECSNHPHWSGPFITQQSIWTPHAGLATPLPDLCCH